MNVMDKGYNEISPHKLRQKSARSYTIAVRIRMLIADIEDDIMDPVMQCTTLPSHSGFSQKKLVSFVTEDSTTSSTFYLHSVISNSMRVDVPVMRTSMHGESNTYVLEDLRFGWRKPCHGDSLNLSWITDPSSETKLQGKFLASFQDDAKYEHVSQDTRSQGGKDDQDGRIKI
ncbi:hypothetical protein Tco_0281716 [Tanacetum coccineum]